MAGPIPAKFILPSFRCSVPPRFIIESIFCIQFSPVSRTSFLTSGNNPQNVKKIVVSMPIAAPVVPRMNEGQILSRSPLHAMITSLSCLTCLGSTGAGASIVASMAVMVLTPSS